MNEIISWRNTNEGFISAILSVVSLLLSFLAIIIAVNANKQQSQVGLFQQRIEVYSEIKRIFYICKRIVTLNKESDHLQKRKMVSMILFSVSSEEYNVCSQIDLKEEELKTCPDNDEDKRKQLLKERSALRDKLVPDIEREFKLVNKVESEFYLLYPVELHKDVGELLELYKDLYMGQSCYLNEVFIDLFEKMSICIKRMEDKHFSKKLVSSTLNI